MAFAAAAAASKRAPFAGLLKNLLVAASSSSSALRPASFAANRHRLFSTGGAPFSSKVAILEEDLIVLYHRLQGRLPNLSKIAWRWWVSKNDVNALQVKMEMPGLAAENVSVSADPKAGLHVKGVDAKDAQDPIMYAGVIRVSREAFELDQTQAEVKDGVLTVTVPRIKVNLAERTEIKVRNAE